MILQSNAADSAAQLSLPLQHGAEGVGGELGSDVVQAERGGAHARPLNRDAAAGGSSALRSGPCSSSLQAEIAGRQIVRHDSAPPARLFRVTMMS